jgi:hypothetical protein
VGKLSGLNESLAAIYARRDTAQALEPLVGEIGASPMLDALNAIVTAVSGIKAPEVRIEFDSAVKQLVKAVNGIKLPEAKPVDLSPIVEAIGKLELEVEIPKPMAPCAYTFKVLRDSSGILTGIIATPGLIEEPEHTDTASYE